MPEEEEQEEARRFLGRFVEEFPAALEDGGPLPVSPLSRRVSQEELRGESLELGLRLLATRGAPADFGALLCQAAFAQLLQDDLSPFHCQQEAEEEQQEAPVLLQSDAVLRLFLNKLIAVATTWRHQLPAPPASSSRCLRCCIHAIKNTRRKMEDKHVALAAFNRLLGLQDGVERAYFAVFDGHGGVDAASYGATHLHVLLREEAELQSDAAAAFKAAFRRTDNMFRNKAKRERLRSGSTGVAALIQGAELTVAWLGDSQALLVRQGLVVTLMDPHKPDRQDERQRIEDLGGCVTFMGCWRVNGTYAVSRAIGDFDQKPYVSSDADAATLPLQGDEDFLLLACDGFFDAVRPSEVPQLVLDALRGTADPAGGGAVEGEGGAAGGEGGAAGGEGGAAGGGGGGGGGDPSSEEAPWSRVAQQLVAHARAAGSCDNITVLLAFLQPPEQLLRRHGNKKQDSSSHDASLP